ncbi:MAG: type IV secretory system conjugative DNA transfer family protein, partial [Candidatus Dormibacteria bacterium]
MTTLAVLAVVGATAFLVTRWVCRARATRWPGRGAGPDLRGLAPRLDPAESGIARWRVLLGRRRWRYLQARWQVATLVVGPPRSGKTRRVIIPNVMAWLGPVVVTSTRADVVHACLGVRSHRGRVWLFDPLGVVPDLPSASRLHWSP